MTTIDNDELVTVAGGATRQPDGSGCTGPFGWPRPRPQPGPTSPGPRDPFGPRLPVGDQIGRTR